jgi:hypothetical protein
MSNKYFNQVITPLIKTVQGKRQHFFSQQSFHASSAAQKSHVAW